VTITDHPRPHLKQLDSMASQGIKRKADALDEDEDKPQMAQTFQRYILLHHPLSFHSITHHQQANGKNHDLHFR